MMVMYFSSLGNKYVQHLNLLFSTHYILDSTHTFCRYPSLLFSYAFYCRALLILYLFLQFASYYSRVFSTIRLRGVRGGLLSLLLSAFGGPEAGAEVETSCSDPL